MDLYMSLNRQELVDSMKEAEERSIERDGDIDGEGSLLYADAQLEIGDGPDFNAATEEIEFSGDIFQDGKNLGYLSMKISLDFEDIISLIELYRKKLGKLKTVLEATKDD